MRFTNVVLPRTIADKIRAKHGIRGQEVLVGLLHCGPLCMRARQGHYVAFTFVGRHITIVFTYDRGQARVVTAYPSSPWQKLLYERKKG